MVVTGPAFGVVLYIGMLVRLTQAEHKGADALWDRRGNAAPPEPGRLRRVGWQTACWRGAYVGAAGFLLAWSLVLKLDGEQGLGICRFNAAVARCCGRSLLGHVQGAISLGLNKSGGGGGVRGSNLISPVYLQHV